jgi:hypothetical protein
MMGACGRREHAKIQASPPLDFWKKKLKIEVNMPDIYTKKNKFFIFLLSCLFKGYH